MMLRKTFVFLFLLLLVLSGFAQQTPGPQEIEMADTMRSNGKIYVVVAVLSAIFVGITVYLVMLDRKITKLEKEA